jgi:tRNA(fMet)-specific endonuclease VapC
MYLLDTNILIHFFKGNPLVREKMSRAGLEKLAISELSLAELYYGGILLPKTARKFSQSR